MKSKIATRLEVKKHFTSYLTESELAIAFHRKENKGTAHLHAIAAIKRVAELYGYTPSEIDQLTTPLTASDIQEWENELIGPTVNTPNSELIAHLLRNHK